MGHLASEHFRQIIIRLKAARKALTRWLSLRHVKISKHIGQRRITYCAHIRQPRTFTQFSRNPICVSIWVCVKLLDKFEYIETEMH